jgi:pantetheine-phosphate adenylyltransferase
VIDVIGPSSERLDHEDIEMLRQTKMSSTFIRQWIVEKYKEEEEEDGEEGSAVVGVGGS